MSSRTWSDEWPSSKPRRPGPSAPRAAGRRPFGATWWGRAWVEAIEQRAQLDPNRLPRGRTYARTGAVGELVLAPGEVLADVQGSRRAPYKVRVRVRPFSDVEWEKLLDALGAEIGHTAALLDGELPPEVASDVASVGLDLLPGPGELQARCSCPDWADPCKHAAAVCYLVADALDTDPFGALLLRGRAREEVLAGLRARRRPGTASPATLVTGEARDQGVLAREAWSRPSGPLPKVADVPRRPGRPTVLAADPPGGVGIELAALRLLAADAAARALALAKGARSSGLELTAAQDLARRAAVMLPGSAASEPGSAANAVGTAGAASEPGMAASAVGTAGAASAGPGSLAELARRAGMPARELVRRGLAFRDGGTIGLELLDNDWDPGSRLVAAGRALLGDGAVARRNRVTRDDRQLRLGHDGLWYPYRKDARGHWSPDGPPVVASSDDEVGAMVEDVARTP